MKLHPVYGHLSSKQWLLWNSLPYYWYVLTAFQVQTQRKSGKEWKSGRVGKSGKEWKRLEKIEKDWERVGQRRREWKKSGKELKRMEKEREELERLWVSGKTNFRTNRGNPWMQRGPVRKKEALYKSRPFAKTRPRDGRRACPSHCLWHLAFVENDQLLNYTPKTPSYVPQNDIDRFWPQSPCTITVAPALDGNLADPPLSQDQAKRARKNTLFKYINASQKWIKPSRQKIKKLSHLSF